VLTTPASDARHYRREDTRAQSLAKQFSFFVSLRALVCSRLTRFEIRKSYSWTIKQATSYAAREGIFGRAEWI
jgi:hypothetical protein